MRKSKERTYLPLSEKVAIVTGGGSGIGRGIAVRFAHAGANVIVAGRRQDALDKVYSKITSSGNRCLAISADITNKTSVGMLVQRTLAEFGKIDILVNNAGISNFALFTEVDDTTRDEVWNTNIKGTWDCCKAVVPTMIRQNYGRIINISSITGPMVASKGLTAYATSKAAISGFTRALALDLAAYGITVTGC